LVNNLAPRGRQRSIARAGAPRVESRRARSPATRPGWM